MRSLLGAALLSLIAGSATGSILFDPPQPTDHMPVTARIDEPWDLCLPGPLQSITRVDDDVYVRFYAYGGCECTFVWRVEVPLGVLPSGTQRVHVFVGNSLVFSKALVVSEVLPEVIVTPAVLDSRESTPVVITTRNDSLCNVTGDAELFVDGVRQSATRTPCAVRATLPPHPAGAVDVVVRTANQEYRTRGTVRYYDREGAPDPWIHERMLVPMLVNEAGAYDSRWVSEATITNVSAKDLVWRHDVARPRNGAVRMPGYSAAPLSIFGEHPTGLVLFVPRELSSNVFFGNLVRDKHHPAQWGIEIPIVRESESYTGIMRIVNVPFVERYRLQLRVYGIDGAAVPFKVRVIQDNAFTENPLNLAAPCTEAELPCDSELPAYAAVDLKAMFPWVQGNRLIRIEPMGVTTPLHYWAMVSVTDNVTQTVTLLTPQ